MTALVPVPQADARRNALTSIKTFNNLLKRKIGVTIETELPDWENQFQFYGNNKAFIDCYYDEPKQHTILLAGPAETGKTITCLSILHQTCLDNPGVECVVVRKVRKHIHNTVARSYLNKILPRDRNNVRIYGGENEPEAILYNNGSRVYFEGMDSVTQAENSNSTNKLLSGEFDLIYFNQAEEASRSDLDKLRGRCTGRAGNLKGKRKGGMLLDCNPAGEDHPLLEMEREGVIKMFKSSHRDNPELFDQETGEMTDQGEMSLGILSSYKGILRDRLFRGLWVGASGTYFKSFSPQTHGIRLADFELNKDWEIWGSMDYGYGHPNVTQFHCKRPGGEVVTFQEIVSLRQRPKHIAPVIHATLEKWGLTIDDLDSFHVGTDAFSRSGRSDKTVAQQYRDFDIILSQADMGPGSRVRRAHTFLDLLGDMNQDEEPVWYYVRETCALLEITIPSLLPDPRNSEAVKKVDANEEGKGGDDAWDCLSYGFKDLTTVSTMYSVADKLKKLKAAQTARNN